MYNRVIMVGNLTKDPELRYTPQGTPIANFRLAVSTRYRSGEEMKEDTLFIDIVVWGKQGETVSQYLSKGRKVLVEGRLTADAETGGPRIWEDNSGQARASYELTALTVQFLSGDGETADKTQGGNEPF